MSLSMSPKPLSLCIVDDHPGVREQLVNMLSAAGHHVVAAVGSVSDGRLAVVRHVPDVAVVDNRLPDGWGLDLCRELSVAVPSVSLVLHTATVDRKLQLDALDAGIHAVVAKTIRGSELLAAIAAQGQDRS